MSAVSSAECVGARVPAFQFPCTAPCREPDGLREGRGGHQGIARSGPKSAVDADTERGSVDVRPE